MFEFLTAFGLGMVVGAVMLAWLARDPNELEREEAYLEAARVLRRCRQFQHEGSPLHREISAVLLRLAALRND